MKQNWNQVEFYYNAHSNFQKQKNERNLAFLSHIKANNLTAFFEDIENGVDVNFVSDISETPLSTAMDYNNLELFELLLKFHADVNYQYDGYSLIWQSLWQDKNDFFKLMVRKINKNTREKGTGKTILMESVLLSNLEAVKAIILSGFNINDKDHNGNTALHYALNKDFYTETDKEIIKFLISSGADVLAKNANGNTPEDVIKEEPTTSMTQSVQQTNTQNYAPKQSQKQTYKKKNTPKPKYGK